MILRVSNHGVIKTDDWPIENTHKYGNVLNEEGDAPPHGCGPRAAKDDPTASRPDPKGIPAHAIPPRPHACGAVGGRSGPSCLADAYWA